MTWIGVLDCNNFFVSCERLFRPDLRRVPVVVLSSNDGCIVARSQEIKDNGVPMGVPYFQVKDTLQQMGAVIFSSHFALYRDISRRVMAVIREEVALVEQYSIDEAFFVFPDEPQRRAAALKARVEQVVGIPVSIGVAASKTQAKFVNDRAKKTTGCEVWSPERWQQEALAAPIGSVWGVGGRLSLRYQQQGWTMIGDVITADSVRLRRYFGVGGLRLQAELAGTAVDLVTARLAAQKSVMSSRSFARATTDRLVIEDALAYHVRAVAADLRAMGQGTGQICVSIRPSRYGAYALRGGTASATLPVPTADTGTLLRIASDLLTTLYDPEVPYQKAGFLAVDVQPLAGLTGNLFTTAGTSVTALDQVIDGLNARFGQQAVSRGTRLRTAVWQAKADQLSPAYTTQWDALRVVRA
jgi:DNA polymerase V